MTDLKSWRLWVIVLLALTTLACAGRRERREEARELRRERMEERRAERQELMERRRAERERSQDAAPAAQQQQEPQQAEQAPRQAEQRPQRQTRAQQRQQLREERQQQREERQQASRKTQERETTAASFTPSAPVSSAAADGASKLVFMRVSKQSAGMDAALFDVTEPGAPKYIGTVNSASKLTYPVNPGLYTFMAVGETAEFMQATIVGGKTYYALVIPRAGAKRFTIEPVRSNEIGTSEFNGWDRNTRASGGAQQAHNAADAAEKRTRYWQEWMNKSQSQRDELTLKAEDGR